MSVGPDFSRWRRRLSALLAVLLFAASLSTAAPASVRASSGALTVTASSDQALADAGYSVNYTPGTDLYYGDYLILEMDSRFALWEDYSSSLSMTIGSSASATTISYFYTIPNYSDGRTALFMRLPEGISAGTPVSLYLGSGTHYQIRNPSAAGTYLFKMWGMHGTMEDAASEDNITIATGGSSVSGLTHSSDPSVLKEYGNYSVQLDFTSSEALGTGDYVNLQFPAGTIFHFDTYNFYGEGHAVELGGENYTSVLPAKMYISGTQIGFPITSGLSGTHYTLYLARGAFELPLGTHSIGISTSDQNATAYESLTIGPSLLSVSLSDNRLKAKDVDYTLTYQLTDTVSESNPVIVSFPEDMEVNWDAFTTSTVYIGTAAAPSIPSSVQLIGDMYPQLVVAPPSGVTYAPGSTVEVILHGLRNPQYNTGPYLFGISTKELNLSGAAYDQYAVSLVYSSGGSEYSKDPFAYALKIKPGQYLTVPNQASNQFSGSDETFSVGMWIKPDTAASGTPATLFDKSADAGKLGVRFQINGDGYLSASVGGMSVTGTTPVPAGQWSHVALVKDTDYQGGAGYLELYLNGNREIRVINEAADYLTLAASDAAVSVGALSGGTEPYQGLMDDLNVWSYAADVESLGEYMYNGADWDVNATSRFPFDPSQVLTDAVSGAQAVFHGSTAATLQVENGAVSSGTLPNPDGFASPVYTVWSAAGAYGALEAGSTAGSYSYTANPNGSGTDTFPFAISQDYTVSLYNLAFQVGPVDPKDAKLVKFTVDSREIPANDTDTSYRLTLNHSDARYVLINAIGKTGQTLYQVEDGMEDPLLTGFDADLMTGDNAFAIRVISPDGTVSRDYTLTVNWPNAEPVAQAAAFSVRTDGVLNGQVHATDPDGDPLYYELVSGPNPSFGSLGSQGISSGTGMFSYTPKPGLTADAYDSFVYAVTDGSSSVQGTVTIHVYAPEAPLLTGLWIGGSADSLSPLDLSSGTTALTATVTSSTYVYVKPAASSASITVNGHLVVSGGVIPIAVTNNAWNFLNIQVTDMAPPFLTTSYTLEVQVGSIGSGSGTTTVSGATYGGQTYGISNGTRIIQAAGLPYGTYSAVFLINSVTGGPANLTSASVLGTSTVTGVTYGGGYITVPLNNTPVTISFTVAGESEPYLLLVSQSDPVETPEPQKPVPLFALAGTSGRDLILRFDIPIVQTTAGFDKSRIRLVIGGAELPADQYTISWSTADSSTLHLTLMTAEPLTSSATVSLLLAAGAVTAQTTGQNDTVSVSVVNLSMYSGGTSTNTRLDVDNLFRVPNLDSLPPAVIYQVLNHVTPRFIAPATQ